MQDASELTDRSALLGGDGEAAGPGGAVEADDAAVLALAGGLEVVDVRLQAGEVRAEGARWRQSVRETSESEDGRRTRLREPRRAAAGAGAGAARGAVRGVSLL